MILNIFTKKYPTLNRFHFLSRDQIHCHKSNKGNCITLPKIQKIGNGTREDVLFRLPISMVVLFVVKWFLQLVVSARNNTTGCFPSLWFQFTTLFSFSLTGHKGLLCNIPSYKHTKQQRVHLLWT